MRCLPVLSFLLALAIAGCAPKPAAGPPLPTRPTITASPVALMIAALDADGDLRVTRAEYDSGVKRSFDSIAGTRRDLSPIDLDRWAERWLGSNGALPGLLDFDSDGDNRVSQAEFAARFAMIFDGFDADRDGVLVRSELISIGAVRMPGVGGPGGRGPGSRGAGGPGGSPPPPR